MKRRTTRPTGYTNSGTTLDSGSGARRHLRLRRFGWLENLLRRCTPVRRFLPETRRRYEIDPYSRERGGHQDHEGTNRRRQLLQRKTVGYKRIERRQSIEPHLSPHCQASPKRRQADGRQSDRDHAIRYDNAPVFGRQEMEPHPVLGTQQLGHESEHLVQTRLQPYLAAKLGVQHGGEVVHRGRRLVKDSVTLEERLQRHINVIEQRARRKGCPQRAAHSSERAAVTEGRVDARETPAYPVLVTPIGARGCLLVAVTLDDDGLRADRTDSGIAKAGDDVAQAVRTERLADIVEHQYLA